MRTDLIQIGTCKHDRSHRATLCEGATAAAFPRGLPPCAEPLHASRLHADCLGNPEDPFEQKVVSKNDSGSKPMSKYEGLLQYP